MTNSQRKAKILIMSVGDCAENGTVRYLRRIGAPADDLVVCLPKASEKFAESYAGDAEVFIYDERKYINKDFEFFGFKPRNCGGVGRQGIAEAVDKYADGNTALLQLDDDTAGIEVAQQDDSGRYVAKTIKKWSNFKKMVLAFVDFYRETGILTAARVAATPPHVDCFIATHKIFNNFQMRADDELKGKGFKALCSDDYRYVVYTNLLTCTPTIQLNEFAITFTQIQGDRSDGNATLYNTDCAWKKSLALKMMFPWASEQRVKTQSVRKQFLENLQPGRLFPPILLEQDNKFTKAR